MQAPERHINHCREPNTYVKTIDGRRFVIAHRRIPEGHEITCDYCINSGGETLWTRRCHAAGCRHEIHSDFFHLPRALPGEHLPLFDEWFRREGSDEIARLTKIG